MLHFIYSYTYWHYTSAIKSVLLHIRNILSFMWRFFAIPGLIRTLFSPWQRLQESYVSGFNIKEKLATLLVNTIMRLVGAVVRLTMILFGIVGLIIAGLLSMTLFLSWLAMPVIIGILLVLIFSTLL